MSHSSNSSRLLWWCVSFLIILLLIVFLWPASSGRKPGSDTGNKTDSSDSSAAAKRFQKRSQPTRPLRDGDPKGNFFHMFDKAANADRFLISKSGHKDLIPDSDAPAGMDLWLQNDDGTERLVSEKVYRAKFSPDGDKIAYTTSDAVLHVEQLNGNKMAEVQHAYDPSWKSDSSAVAFSKGPENAPVTMPGTLALSVLDVKAGTVQTVTDGKFDDVRPEFGPSDEWLLFVSGGRTGLAAFWKVPLKGGEPEQVTNVGMQGVNDAFVPTPYSRTLWTPDGWFIYDFKNGPREETWGLRFDRDGHLVSSKKIGDGIDPRLNGGNVTTLKHNPDSEKVDVGQYTLP